MWKPKNYWIFNRQRKSGKSDFAVSANMAYGQVKVEGVGGEYEDPDKLQARFGQGGVEYPAPYEFPANKLDQEAPMYM